MIRLLGIQRHFQMGEETVHALRDIDLHLPPGEYAAIMGPSGSGKSTLLNILGLLDRPDAGSYELAGTDTTRMDDDHLARLRRDQIGFVFQAFHLIPRLSAHANVELPLILAGIDPDERRARVDAMLDSLNLTDRAGHRPDQLSGGQRQRVAVARAMIMRPGLLLCDEPTGNLDKQSGKELIDLLESLNRSGVTLLVVTHDPEIGDRAGRRIRLEDGRVLEDA